MSDGLRDRLYDEMSSQHRPPSPAVVETAIRRGTHTRRARRTASSLGTLAVVGAAVGVIVLGSQAAPSRTTSTAAGSSSAPARVNAAPVVVAPPTAAAGKPTAKAATPPVAAVKAQPTLGPVVAPPAGVHATPAGMVELLTKTLPAGSTSSHYGRTTSGDPMIEAYVNAGHGTGMIRLGLWKYWGENAMCIAGDTCYKTAAGDLIDVGALSTNCIQSRFVRVVHPDGNGIDINIASCLEWNGTANVAAPEALTVDQAVALGLDPRWDISMDPALVSAGAARFPTLPTFS